MKPDRLLWIDYAKGIAIILVLYRHVFEGIKQSGIAVNEYLILEQANIIFFSFRMPLFFIVSGIFVAFSLQKRGLERFIETKGKTILYPYFLWGALQITLQLVFSKFVNGQRTLFDYLYLFYLPREIEQFWYLYALFNVTILFAFLKAKRALTHFQNILLGLLLFNLSVIAFQKNMIIGFVGDIFHYYIFFAIGDAVSQFITDRKKFKIFESWKIFFILLVPFIFSQLYFLFANMSYIDKKYQYVEYYQPFFFILIALTGCAFTMNIAFILQKTRTANWLRILGKHSLYIYVAHVLVLASVRTLMVKFFGITNVPVLLFTGIVSGLLIPVLLFKIANKMKVPWLFSLENIKRPQILNLSS